MGASAFVWLMMVCATVQAPAPVGGQEDGASVTCHDHGQVSLISPEAGITLTTEWAHCNGRKGLQYASLRAGENWRIPEKVVVINARRRLLKDNLRDMIYIQHITLFCIFVRLEINWLLTWKVCSLQTLYWPCPAKQQLFSMKTTKNLFFF